MKAVYGGFVVSLAFAVSIRCDVCYAKPGEDLCNFARVETFTAGGTATVHSGPGVKFRKVGTLNSGVVIYICDSTDEWYKVFYGSGSDPCSTSTEQGLPAEKTRSCRSGWVSKRMIKVISG